MLPWLRPEPGVRGHQHPGKRLLYGLSASRIAACCAPSARKISDCLKPSASRIDARFSRSAFICLPIASTKSLGGAISFDFNAGCLYSPGRCCIVNNGSSLALISSCGTVIHPDHRSHDGTNIGHYQIQMAQSSLLTS